MIQYTQQNGRVNTLSIHFSAAAFQLRHVVAGLQDDVDDVSERFEQVEKRIKKQFLGNAGGKRLDALAVCPVLGLVPKSLRWNDFQVPSRSNGFRQMKLAVLRFIQIRRILFGLMFQPCSKTGLTINIQQEVFQVVHGEFPFYIIHFQTRGP